jgi:protein subunit release factor B
LVENDRKREDLLSVERYLIWLKEKIRQYNSPDGVTVNFEGECETEFVRSSGAGGQNVNKK